jgi:hypothetical protein
MCRCSGIETMFEMLKHVLHIFNCHFWSKSMPKHSRKPKSNKTLQSPPPAGVKNVQACWNATECFVNLGAIALGLLQLIALTFSSEIWNKFDVFLRTRSRDIPSERTTKMVIANLLIRDFLNLAPTAIMREIRSKIIKGVVEKKLAKFGQYQEQQAA